MNRSHRMPAILFSAAAMILAITSHSFAQTRVAQAAANSDVSSAPAAPADTTKADYEAAERLDSLGAWDVYLAQHPAGEYTAQAQERRAKAAARIAALPGSTPAPGDGPGAGSKAAPAARAGLSYLSTVECAAKFQTAKLTRKLNGRKWDDFKASECGPQATRAAVEPAAVTTPPPVGNATFPAAVDPKYAKEYSDKSRMLTCADQFNANKVANANGGMKWIDKGGGYYAECNRRLKGA